MHAATEEFDHPPAGVETGETFAMFRSVISDIMPFNVRIEK